MSSVEDRVNVGVAAVLMDAEGRFLLGKRLADKHGQGTFGFPGGKPDPGESPDEAVLRELAEETGIVADYAQPLGLWTYDRFDGHGVHYVTLYFMVDHGDQEPVNTEPEKCAGWNYIDAEVAATLPLFSGVPRVLQTLAAAWA